MTINFNEYLHDYNQFISKFEIFTPSEYFKLTQVVAIPLNFLTRATLDGFEINDFKKSIGDQMYWTMTALNNYENIYEDVSLFMNSYTFHPPIWILSRLIGFIMGCNHYKFKWDKYKLLDIATNAACSDIYVNYINNYYSIIIEILAIEVQESVSYCTSNYELNECDECDEGDPFDYELDGDPDYDEYGNYQGDPCLDPREYKPWK